MDEIYSFVVNKDINKYNILRLNYDAINSLLSREKYIIAWTSYSVQPSSLMGPYRILVATGAHLAGC